MRSSCNRGESLVRSKIVHPEREVLVAVDQRHETAHETRNVFLNATHHVAIFFVLTAVVLFTLLFSTYPPIHDFFHGLRHALMIIPCH